MAAGRKRDAPRAVFRPVEQRPAIPGANPRGTGKKGRKAANKRIAAEQKAAGQPPIPSAKVVRARLQEQQRERLRLQAEDADRWGVEHSDGEVELAGILGEERARMLAQKAGGHLLRRETPGEPWVRVPLND